MLLFRSKPLKTEDELQRFQMVIVKLLTAEPRPPAKCSWDEITLAPSEVEILARGIEDLAEQLKTLQNLMKQIQEVEAG